MSQYGVEQMQQAGFDPYYVPHGVDPQVWYPQDKAKARHTLNIAQDSFFVAFVGVNDSIPSRKGSYSVGNIPPPACICTPNEWVIWQSTVTAV